ncbi:Vigilin 1, partial [Leucoagaricus sp. SymC.cos]
RRHELEGAPDPFPSLGGAIPTKPKVKASTSVELDTQSETAFPSLAPSASAPTAPVASAWGGPRIKAAVVKQPVFSDSITLSDIDLSTAGKDGKPASLGEVMKQVTTKYKVKLEASPNLKTRQTTFYLKTDSEKDLEKAKRSLVALLSPVITLVINAPASTIATIIGPRGATLKQIRDQTSVRVDIPKKEAANGNGQISVTNSGKATPPLDEDEEEPTVPITLTGPQPLAHEAQSLLNQIISSKISKATSRVRDIPANVLPFIIARKTLFLSNAQEAGVNLALNAPNREITASGDREGVMRLVELIKNSIESLKTTLTPLKLALPKRQHRLLVGDAAHLIMAESKCAVVVPSSDDPSDEITIWGQGNDLSNGLTAVMQHANSKYIHEFPVPGPTSISRNLITFFKYISYDKTLKEKNPGVTAFLPIVNADRTSYTIDLTGDKPVVDSAVRQVSEAIGKLYGATKDITIDWLLHRIITGKNVKKIKQFHDAYNVQVFFPKESEESSSVLLVYDPFSPNASPSPDDKKRNLDDVERELLRFAKDAADVKSQKIDVEKRWHETIIGHNGTTLNAIIGEDKTLIVKFGLEAGDGATEDTILTRGISADVDRAVKEILQIVENAKNDEIINSYSTEFEIDREYVGRVVGAQGVGVNRLRDQLGVRVDVNDEEDKESSGKKKKSTVQKSKVKITGRKENVEEAKKRILAQVERLADETSEVLKIPVQYHASLIGQNGKYAIRLEEKYAVKITFPRQNADAEGKTREQLKPDEVLIKGGKKGVASAKSELLEALEVEKESNHVTQFTVPTRTVARILGKGGASINEIKDITGANVDIEHSTDDNSMTNVSIRGTKPAINEAKTLILEIVNSVGEETTVILTIENKYHRTLIGAGGQGLRELISRCGGPTDSKAQAGLVRFPRQGEDTEEVRIRGEPKLVNKIKTELERSVATLRDRVVRAVEVPNAQHRVLIGRGGQNLNELQNKTGAQIQFPGSRSYAQVGEAENAEEFTEVNSADIVKVSGSRAACEAAIAELKSQIKPPTPEGVVGTVNVPLKYHYAMSQQGAFYRSLRTHGVQVEQSAQPTKSAVPTGPSSKAVPSVRIDEAETEEALEVQWIVEANYQDAEEGESIWTLKARDQAGLDKAQQLVAEAIHHAEQMTRVGYLTLPDRSSFPRIVGSKGANVARLRQETGADITVSREDTTITIIGSESDIEAAKTAIVKLASTPAGRPRHN